MQKIRKEGVDVPEKGYIYLGYDDNTVGGEKNGLWLKNDDVNEFLQDYKISPSDLNTFIEEPRDFLNRVVFKYPFIDNQYTIF